MFRFTLAFSDIHLPMILSLLPVSLLLLNCVSYREHIIAYYICKIKIIYFNYSPQQFYIRYTSGTFQVKGFLFSSPLCQFDYIARLFIAILSISICFHLVNGYPANCFTYLRDQYCQTCLFNE